LLINKPSLRTKVCVAILNDRLFYAIMKEGIQIIPSTDDDNSTLPS